MTEIECKCGNIFEGVSGKEDTCPECLKKLIRPHSPFMKRLGKCPFCDSNNYSRGDNDINEDYFIVECSCNNCGGEFTEYFGLDEVKFEKEGEEFVYSKSLSHNEKQIIMQLCGVLARCGNFDSGLPITDDERNSINRILNILNGGLNEN